MICALRAENRLVRDRQELYIEHIFDKSIIQVRLGDQVDYNRLQNMLYEGIDLDRAKPGRSEETKLLLGLLKSAPERFLLSKNRESLNKELNVRNVFHLCERTGTPNEELARYRQALDQTNIRVLGDVNGVLTALLINNGFQVNGMEDAAAVDPARRTIVVAERLYLNREDSIPDCSCILPYSVDEMTLGPCAFSKQEQIDLTGYSAVVHSGSDTPTRPSYANLLTVYSLLVNNLLFLINDTHRKLYVDAALSINRIFRFTLPEMKMTASQAF